MRTALHEASSQATIEGDHRPVFTLWKAQGKHVVWVFQSEGGSVTQEAADAYFDALRGKVASTEGDFATLYDFTQPLSNFVPFALQLAQNAREIRERMRPMRTVIVCPNATARNVMRIIIATVGGSSPYVLVEDITAAWVQALEPRSATDSGVRDCYEGQSLTSGLDPTLMASAASQNVAAGSSA